MVNWFAWKRGYLGKSILQKWLLQLSDTVAHKDKTLPRIQNTSQNPKHVPESKNTSQNPKTHPRIQNTSQNPKTHPRIQKDFPESKTGPRIQNTSQIWILESFFEFWDVFWIPGSVFGFLEVFWILGRVLSLRTTVIRKRNIKQNAEYAKYLARFLYISIYPKNVPTKKVDEEVSLLKSWKYFEWLIKRLLNSAFV